MDASREDLQRHFRESEDDLDREAVGNADPRDLLPFTGTMLDEAPAGETGYFRWIEANERERRLPHTVFARAAERMNYYWDYAAGFNASLVNLIVSIRVTNEPGHWRSDMQRSASVRAYTERMHDSFVQYFMREIDGIAALVDAMEARLEDERAPVFEYVRIPHLPCVVLADKVRERLSALTHEREVFNAFALPSEARVTTNESPKLRNALADFVHRVSRWTRMDAQAFLQRFHACMRHCAAVTLLAHQETNRDRFHKAVETGSFKGPDAALAIHKRARQLLLQQIGVRLQRMKSNGEEPPLLDEHWFTYARLIPQLLMRYHSVMLHLQNREHYANMQPQKRRTILEHGDMADAADRVGKYANGPWMAYAPRSSRLLHVSQGRPDYGYEE